MDSFSVASFVAVKNATKKSTTKLPLMAGVMFLEQIRNYERF
jgi:hypothetical protein